MANSQVSNDIIVVKDHQYILPPRANENIDESYWTKVFDETQLIHMQENIINNFIINPRAAANFLHNGLIPYNDIISRIILKSINDSDGMYYLNNEMIIEIISNTNLYCFYSKDVANRLLKILKKR